MMIRYMMLVPFLVMLVTSGIAAQQSDDEPLVTDRPDFTESSETIHPRRVQLEFGYTFERSGDVEIHTVGEILARVGVRDNLELRLGINSYANIDSPGGELSGPEDTFLGLKIKLLEGQGKYGDAVPHIALIGGTSVPTGGDEITTDEWEPEFVLALAWDLSERFALGSNLGFAYLAEGEDRFSQVSGSIALGYSLSEKVGAYVEYYGFLPSGKEGPDTGFLNGGFTYLVNNDFQLDLRAGIGHNDPDPEYFVGLGAAVRL
jgi:hypothetical protein